MSLAFFDLIALTCNSLCGNPLRSALTTLGVFMGVAAVSATLQVRTISTEVIAKQLAKREAPQIGVYPEWQRGIPYRSLQLEDAAYLRQRLGKAKAISAVAGVFFKTVLFQDKSANPDMYAVSLEYFETTGRDKISGRFFTVADFENYRSVAVIDQILAESLFSGQDPIGKRLYLDSKSFIIVGVVKSKLMYAEQEPKGLLLLPLSIYRAITGSSDVDITIRPYRLEEMEMITEQAKKLLKQRSPGRDFNDWNNIDDIREQQKTLKMVSKALLAVGGVALLVGGVGIANITIAAVLERTSEIGLRKAIGATQRDIMWQFILEAAFLSLIGGILAIITVHGLTIVVAKTFELPYKFDEKMAALALGSALFVGVGAGFLPALKASQLDPVHALRS